MYASIKTILRSVKNNVLVYYCDENLQVCQLQQEVVSETSEVPYFFYICLF